MEVMPTASMSLVLFKGNSYSLDYGCKAGNTTITVYVYAKYAGQAALRVIEDNGNLIVEDTNALSNTREQLSVTFASTQKIYTVQLINKGKNPEGGGDMRAYFDDLV